MVCQYAGVRDFKLSHLSQLQINDLISKTIGPIAKPDKIQLVPGLPKTRSGKIMRIPMVKSCTLLERKL